MLSSSLSKLAVATSLALFVGVFATACGDTSASSQVDHSPLGGAGGAGPDDGGPNDRGSGGDSSIGGAGSGSSGMGGSGRAKPAKPLEETYVIGGTVTGLEGDGLVLLDQDGNELAISDNGTFVFSDRLEAGQSFDVSILNEPHSPTQTCTVSGGQGNISDGHVTSITVNCATDRFVLGGSVVGLEGTGLVLATTGGDEVMITANGDYAFPQTLASGSGYEILVQTPPHGLSQTCSVSQATGVVRATNVTNVDVTCTTNEFTVSATVSGLSGSGLVIQNNGGDDLEVEDNGVVTFPTALMDGSEFEVSVLTHPAGPTQLCEVSGGTGTLGGANVESITIECAGRYTVGGTVSGVEGSGLVLQNNGGDDLAVAANGTFAFPTVLEDSQPYDVTVLSGPTDADQICTVENGSGNVAGADVTDVSVVCTTRTYSVGGTVSGLEGTGLVLQNNGGDDLLIAADGSFEMPTDLENGTTYHITVLTQPQDKAQICAVSQGTGMIAKADVTDVAVTCHSDSFSVGGKVRGLDGGSIVLSNNGSDTLVLDSSGPFTFPVPVTSGRPFHVTLDDQPEGESCVVTPQKGTVQNSNVFVLVNCGDFTGGEDFESGSLGDSWTVGTDHVVEITEGSAANGTSLGLQLTGKSSHYEGIQFDFPACQIEYASVWMQPDDEPSPRNYFVFGDSNTSSNRGVVFFYGNNETWRAVGKNESHDMMPITPFEWVHFEFTFNWDTKTYDVTANGTRVADDVENRANSLEMSQWHLYNWSTSATAKYDEFRYLCASE